MSHPSRHASNLNRTNRTDTSQPPEDSLPGSGCLTQVSFHAAGWCRQSARLAGRPDRGSIRFHAVFVRIEHPTFGTHLIDTGYGPGYLDAIRRFPESILGRLLPTTIGPERSPDEVLRRAGVPLDSIGSILISHFHGDHVGGLDRFPNVRLAARGIAYETPERRGRLGRLMMGYVRELVPSDFAERVDRIDESEFVAGVGLLDGFRVRDHFGDGSLWWVDLPGHAAGHVGFLLRTNDEAIFYVVDACWDVPSTLAGRPMPFVSRRVQFDARAYQATRVRLKAWSERFGRRPIACHCHETLARVADLPD